MCQCLFKWNLCTIFVQRITMKRIHKKEMYLIIDLVDHYKSSICRHKVDVADVIGIHRNSIDLTEKSTIIKHYLVLKQDV